MGVFKILIKAGVLMLKLLSVLFHFKVCKLVLSTCMCTQVERFIYQCNTQTPAAKKSIYLICDLNLKV